MKRRNKIIFYFIAFLLIIPIDVVIPIICTKGIDIPQVSGIQNSNYSIIIYVLALISYPVVNIICAISLDPEKAGEAAEKIRISRWIHFLASIVGALIAIQFTTTGTLISVIGTVQDKTCEKIEDYLTKKHESG